MAWAWAENLCVEHWTSIVCWARRLKKSDLFWGSWGCPEYWQVPSLSVMMWWISAFWRWLPPTTVEPYVSVRIQVGRNLWRHVGLHLFAVWLWKLRNFRLLAAVFLVWGLWAHSLPDNFESIERSIETMKPIQHDSEDKIRKESTWSRRKQPATWLLAVYLAGCGLVLRFLGSCIFVKEFQSTVGTMSYRF